jgi:hypothetical protein
MAATKEDIEGWIDEGIAQGATHVIVVCDDFNYEDYPVYVMASQIAQEVVDGYNGVNMQRVMEVYDLSLSIEDQLLEHRAWNV